MERLREKRTSGISTSVLRAWGMFLLAVGVIGRCILQHELLGVGSVSTEELLEIMQSSQYAMLLASLALVLQALETCAVPIFALLLVEGFQHTTSYKNYLLRVVGAAFLSELPYNLAMSGQLLDTSSRNPMFGLVFGLLVLYFFNLYQTKSAQNVLIKAVVAFAALLWPLMLNVDFGFELVVAVCVLWVFRKKPMYRGFIGATAMILCSLLSPFFLAAPMGFLATHFYNGEKGSGNRWINYLFYPAMLLLVGLLAKFVF